MKSLWLILLFPATLLAQAEPGMVTLDLPPQIELRVLAEAVSSRLDVPILYDEAIENQTVNLRVAGEIPEDALLGVLQSALQLKGFTLADAATPGWKQIVPSQNLAAIARPVADAAGEVGAVTQVFPLDAADPTRASDAVRSLLSSGGNLTVLPDARVLIVSDDASVVRRAQQVIRDLEAGSAGRVIRFVTLSHADAARTAELAGEVLGGGVTLRADPRTNEIILGGPAEAVNRAEMLLTELDRPSRLETRAYRPIGITPEALADLLDNTLAAGDTGAAFRATPDPATGTLVVAASGAIHDQIDALVAQLDRPASPDASPVRFYKLKNTDAGDVLQTLSSLLGGQTPTTPADETGFDSRTIAGRGNETFERSVLPAADGTERFLPLPGTPEPVADTASVIPPAEQERRGRNQPAGPLRFADATVAADANTNSIVVIAPPPTQQLLSDLIDQLDTRRPQVQIEVTIVTLDTTNGYTFGVDIGNSADVSDDGNLITFSSFGIAGIDPLSGSLTPLAGTGGTVALLDPDTADVVLRALSNNSRSRLVSMPQVLVNDNATGTLDSTRQEPFAVITDTDASQTRTSLGGFAEAGTRVRVTPHISDDDYLQLAYAIEQSSFTGSSSNGLPPPSQSNNVESDVTIPDASTIVVGGLRIKNYRETRSGLPLLDQIPVLNLLFGTRSEGYTDSTLFVFIKPTILRDERFQDLKYLSGLDADRAELDGDFPESDPIPLK